MPGLSELIIGSGKEPFKRLLYQGSIGAFVRARWAGKQAFCNVIYKGKGLGGLIPDLILEGKVDSPKGGQCHLLMKIILHRFWDIYQLRGWR